MAKYMRWHHNHPGKELRRMEFCTRHNVGERTSLGGTSKKSGNRWGSAQHKALGPVGAESPQRG
ncbi:uncharacterized protein CIMG_13746 [Coccidioides immitis RS]|uniref:Uncharacterized protein n=1 Tax=Coccidioides immitis (strain RS) TaxID=246410 RepID=J3KC70_COCIM|nr:uncharacterized protein CIMG_13746 [Coccidioides immitis RS]EAS32799.3 hypothetical protein CIMG_13746 [Coccidioides immitis RS]